MDSGKKFFLDYLTNFGGDNLVGVVAKLYTNDVIPGHASILANFALAAWAGYANQTLTGWGGSNLDGANRAQSTASLVGFGNTSGVAQACFGYIVTDITGAILLFAERFAGAPLSIPNGLSLGLQVTFTQQSEF
jgi:hypothetical protein